MTHSNYIAGTTHTAGPVIQAGDIHGGLTITTNGPAVSVSEQLSAHEIAADTPYPTGPAD